jgi:hypothetical protein
LQTALNAVELRVVDQQQQMTQQQQMMTQQQQLFATHHVQMQQWMALQQQMIVGGYPKNSEYYPNASESSRHVQQHS